MDDSILLNNILSCFSEKQLLESLKSRLKANLSSLQEEIESIKFDIDRNAPMGGLKQSLQVLLLTEIKVQACLISLEKSELIMQEVLSDYVGR